MAISENGKAEYAGAVLEVGSRYVHVPSDNAMIDSGFVRWARVWDGRLVRELSFHCGRGGYEGLVLEKDATPEAEHLAATYRAANAAAEKVVQAFRGHALALKDAAKVATGKTVRVVKGRKAPKGTVARVYGWGENDYGPYARLESLDRSQAWRFINPDNLEVVVSPGDVSAPPYSEDCLRMARAALGGHPYGTPADPDAYGKLADALDDLGLDEEAGAIRPYVGAVLYANA